MAGRPRTIDRDRVLDAAEAVVAETGAAGLSFEAVARAAGITKGGVQYCFGTKDNLVQALIARWADGFEAEVMARAGDSPSARAVAREHVTVTRDTDEAEHARSAALMAAVMQRPEQVALTRDWYTRRLAGLDLSMEADRRTAVAFLAGEGAFLLKAFGLIDIDADQWRVLFGEILALAGDD